jgi:hypothetical protein
LEGKSFAPACRGEAEHETWEEIGIMSADMHSVITSDGWRLTRWLEEDAGQLFHLAEDPYEQQNLYESPEHAAKKTELLERLIKVNLRPYQIPQFRNLPAARQAALTREKEV